MLHIRYFSLVVRSHHIYNDSYCINNIIVTMCDAFDDKCFNITYFPTKCGHNPTMIAYFLYLGEFIINF